MILGRVRLAGWAVPMACFAVVAALIAQRHTAFVAAVRRAHRLDLDLNRAYADANALNRLRKEPRFACASRSTKEESTFFAGLRRHAALADVSIVRLRSETMTLDEKHVPIGSSKDEASVGAVTTGVTKISCQLVIDGTYPALRRFLRGLWRADRLYTMSDVSWGRAKDGTELAFTLHRYLAPSAPSKEAPNS